MPQRLNLYSGAILKLPATAASLNIVSYVKNLLVQGNSSKTLQSLYGTFSQQGLHEEVVRQGTAIKTDAGLREHYALWLQKLGADLRQWSVDVPRLRVIPPGLEHNPNAKSAFSAHRDSWYANPSAQLNL